MLTKEEKDKLKRMLGKLPEDPNKIPASLFKYNPAEIAELIEDLIEYYKPAPPPNDGREFTQGLLDDLDRFKDSLGGAPNFQDGIVTLNNDDANKTFMGQPLPAVKDWFRKTLNEGWRPKSFWTFVAKHFNVTKKGQTQYENTHERIQRFGLLHANREKINEILESGDATRYPEFGQITGLAWHPNDNHSSIEKEYMDMVDRFMTDYYEDAKEKGDEALIEYFESFNGVCFEDRCSKIQEYIATHQLTSEVDNAQTDILMTANLSDCADYTDQTNITQVISQELSEYYAAHGEIATPQQLWDRLEAKGVTGKSFPTTAGGMATLDADYLNQDSVREEFMDEHMIMEEGDKIVTKDADMSLEKEDVDMSLEAERTTLAF